MKMTCNTCLDEFDVAPNDITLVRMDDLAIQYFPCPSCGRKYVIFAANGEMQRLIVERSAIQKKIRAARAGKFREQTFRKLILRQEEISMKQKKLMAVLKPRAEQLLNEVGHGEV